MIGARAVVATTLLAVVIPATASGASPPGATARCNDGTYSYSTHHSGTCSHHGGVAVWLSGPLSGSASTGSSSISINIGKTVLLAVRTRTSGCKLGALPDRRCSPGAYYSSLTKTVICASSFRTSAIRNVPQSEKFQVEREYGLAAARYGRTLEIDHIVSLELGGSNNIANLYPEKASARPGYRVKDALENRLHSMVCAGRIALRSAQQQIAANWERLYLRVYGIAPVG
jgi:hypothetical protein